MKAIWLAVLVVAAVAFLPMTEGKPDEPGKARSAPELMIGTEPGEVRDDNGLKMKLVWCPPGEFTMGSPESEFGRMGNEDQVTVTLTKGFWLGMYEVTQSEWKQVMATEPWKVDNKSTEGDDFPTTFVSWEDAIEFCRKLLERERKAGRVPDGWEYTLPTEAQWERACRAGTETKFSFGDDESDLDEYAWFRSNSAKAGAQGVGQKKPNPWGLYDMHGNVRELCRDRYKKELPGGRDPEVNKGDSARVMRGGWWLFPAERCRSAFRGQTDPTKRGSGLGPKDASPELHSAA
jgi:formylglycine-generating enzyme required for sulfatase activity